MDFSPSAGKVVSQANGLKAKRVHADSPGSQLWCEREGESWGFVAEKNEKLKLSKPFFLYIYTRDIYTRNIHIKYPSSLTALGKKIKHLSQTPPFHCRSTFEILLDNAGPNVVRQPVVGDVSPFCLGGCKRWHFFKHGVFFVIIGTVGSKSCLDEMT